MRLIDRRSENLGRFSVGMASGVSGVYWTASTAQPSRSQKGAVSSDTPIAEHHKEVLAWDKRASLDIFLRSGSTTHCGTFSHVHVLKHLGAFILTPKNDLGTFAQEFGYVGKCTNESLNLGDE